MVDQADRNQGTKELAEKIVADSARGGSGDSFRDEIGQMTDDQRLSLVKDLQVKVPEHNQGGAQDPLYLEARLDKKDGTVKDIDIIRAAAPNDPVKNLNRLDLYDSGDKAGLEADEKQKLDALTAPFEHLYFSRIGLSSSQEMNNPALDSEGERRDPRQELIRQTTREMLAELNITDASGEEARKLVENFSGNVNMNGEGHTKLFDPSQSFLKLTSDNKYPAWLSREINQNNLEAEALENE
ncbi:MAG: hypothetical protein J0M35_18740 [Candidatus Obscuribacter phosphatis]|uniref:Uncharacterized protein n=1 Tax=Candidatus Obscuribacter phosphatis TaxID=1906157 RepID=A0A8J7P8Y9_9BACT|nr:hypothetical protein [Candidatus Obscuribacter phosphatis]